MAKNSYKFIFPLVILLCVSCATIFNLPNQTIEIITDEPGNISVDKFQSDTALSYFCLSVTRSSIPLKLSVTRSQSTKIYSIQPHNSLAYWLNIYPAPYVGFFVDMKNPKRYSYPKQIYINTHDRSNKYLTYRPLDSISAKRKNLISITPLRLFALSNSGVEVNYERKTGNSLATEFMATYLLPTNILDMGDFNHDTRGYRFVVEEKFYLKKSAPIGPYLGFGINHLNTHYKEIEEFGPAGINSRDNNFVSYADSILIYKRTTDYNLLFGFQEITNRLSIDFYCGLGLRNRYVVHRNRINTDDVMVSPIDLNFNYLSNLEGKYMTGIFLLGIKIGWMF